MRSHLPTLGLRISMLIAVASGSVQAQSSDPASLDRLSDIVVPSPVPWLPPAPGWYAVLAVILLAIMVYAISLYRRYKVNQYRREALAELTDLHTGADSLVPLAELLKRTAMTFSGRPSVAALTGPQWVDWLNGQCQQPIFVGRSAELLAKSVYRMGVGSSSQDIDHLAENCRAWIKNHQVDEGSSMS
jgi:hypothetical protein